MKQVLRVLLEIIILAVFGVIAFMLIDEFEVMSNPLGFIALIPLKLSMSILHWHTFRKIYFKDKVDWSIKLKDIDVNTFMAVTSFVVFAFVYTSFS